MKIGIIGAGSIGLLTASYLAAQHHITLYVRRKEQYEQLKRQGVSLYRSGEYQTTQHINVAYISELKDEECYIVCIKQTSMQEMIPYLSETNDRPIIFLQNGMGHLTLLHGLHRTVYVGVVEHGAKRMNDVTVDHLGKGKIKIAHYQGMKADTQQLRDQLYHETFPFEIQCDYFKMLTDKLIINAVINPLTAIFHVQNGKIIENESIQEIAKVLCKEAAEVLQIDRHAAWKKIEETALATKENTSSMYGDILAGRATEIHAISGYIMEQAKNEVPYTQFVYQAILGLEKRS